MKKILILLLVIVLAVPVSAVLAKEITTFQLEFRNRTGGVVSLDLVDSNGNHKFVDVAEGVSYLDVFEGKYAYYASTVCGVEVGIWNMNVKKVAIFKCDSDGLYIDLDRMCYWPGFSFPIGFQNPFDNYPDNFTHTSGCWKNFG